MNPPRFVAISPGDGRELAPWIEALGRAGLPALLLREPKKSPAELRALVKLAQRHIKAVIVHQRSSWIFGDLPIHLSGGGKPEDWRGHPQIGVSCHSEAEVEAALARGASYVFLSPVWKPTSKADDPRATLGLEAYLRLAVGRPVLALGGTTSKRYRLLLRSGGWGAAVIGDLFGQPSPQQAAQRLKAYGAGF